MRLGLLVPPIIITSMMTIGLLIVVNFENQVPTAAQEAIAAKAMPFMDMSTSGNLVFSFGAFLLVTLIADLVVFVPLFLLDRHIR